MSRTGPQGFNDLVDPVRSLYRVSEIMRDMPRKSTDSQWIHWANVEAVDILVML